MEHPDFLGDKEKRIFKIIYVIYLAVLGLHCGM